MKLLRLLFIFFVLAFSGCASNVETLNRLSVKRNESTQAYITGIVDSLGLIQDSSRLPETNLAEKLAIYAQENEGIPSAGNRLNVNSILLKNKKDVSQLNSLREEDIDNSKKIKQSEDRLLELGSQKEAENNKSFFHKLLFWSISTFGIGGVITLCIFFPFLIPIFIKIIGFVISSLLKFIPSLVHFFGVVGSNAFENVVKGVGEVRNELKNVDPQKTYTAEEVLGMLDTELHKHTDKNDREIIDNFRKKLNI